MLFVTGVLWWDIRFFSNLHLNVSRPSVCSSWFVFVFCFFCQFHVYVYEQTGLSLDEKTAGWIFLRKTTSHRAVLLKQNPSAWVHVEGWNLDFQKNIGHTLGCKVQRINYYASYSTMKTSDRTSLLVTFEKLKKTRSSEWLAAALSRFLLLGGFFFGGDGGRGTKAVCGTQQQLVIFFFMTDLLRCFRQVQERHQELQDITGANQQWGAAGTAELQGPRVRDWGWRRWRGHQWC